MADGPRPVFPMQGARGSQLRIIGSVSVSCTMPLIDVCDLCWGTGDALRPGTNLRLMWARKQEAEARVVVLELELKEARA